MATLSYWEREEIRSGFERIKPRIGEFSVRFYDHLFAINPGYRALFPADLTVQRVRFVQIWSTVLGMLDRLDECEVSFRQLGQRHIAYGVKPSDFPVVGQALLATLPEFLADEFTPEVEAAWATLYSEVSAAMISNMEQNAA